MTDRERRRGVLLMTYGSPDSDADVPRYLAAVRGGRPAADELIAEFQRRYRSIDGSPLIPITSAQAAALQRRLGDGTAVRAAMRFSEPTLGSVVSELATEGISEIVGIVLSPQYSPLLMGGYARELDAAVSAVTWPSAPPRVHMAGAWHLEPAFIAAMASRIRDAIAHRPVHERGSIPVLMTAHSLPLRVAEREPDYLGQLRDTADAVATAADITSDQWRFCWQSAGHEPGEWMKPDFADLMPELAADGHRAVIVAPIQFLADHLETLYDVDIGAREQAERHGLGFARIEALNDSPDFIEALARIVARETGAAVAPG